MFRYIQTFYLDSAVVKDSGEASITSIGLYFRAKPKYTGNKSGIVGPGVEVSIVPCIGGIPQIQEAGTIRPPEPAEHGARFAPRFEIARKEWGEITATGDASVETRFTFKEPIQVKTKLEYGVVIKFDGAEDYVLWYSRQGQKLVGSTTISPGVSGKYVGNLFNYVGNPTLDINNLIQVAQDNTNAADKINQTNAKVPELAADAKYLAQNWKPITAVDLKFKVYVARYAHNGSLVAGNSAVQADVKYQDRFVTDNLPIQISNTVIRMAAPSLTQEYIQFDANKSTLTNLSAGENIWQKQPYFPASQKTPITVSVTAGTQKIVANSAYLYSNGSTFNNSNGFNTLFTKDTADVEYIVIDHGTTHELARVVSIDSNTTLTIDRFVQLTNTTAKIYKTVSGKYTGINNTYLSGQDMSIMTLTESNANSSLRFVNTTILTATVNVGGSGYSNNDYVTINGFESTTSVVGGFAAKLLLTTNSTGGVVNTFIANAGCGFVYPDRLTGSNVVFSNSTGGSSSGTGATFSFDIGAVLKTEKQYNNQIVNAVAINLEATRLKPEITVNNPLGTSFTVNHRSLFYSIADANNYSGRATHVRTNSSATDIPVKIFKSHDVGTEEFYSSTLPSRSNEFVTTFANGVAANTSVIGNKHSNSCVYLFDVTSNNDYSATYIEPNIIHSHYSKYIINNDYTNEHTNYGNAYAKHIATKVNFGKDRYAEDILVYLTAYRPAGTDFKVFARVHNNNDPDAFDDKDWTMLEEIDGIGVYSSIADSTDYIELTYNFKDTANSTLLVGSVQVDNVTTTTITGSGTTFTSSLANNDLIKITNPLFAANSFVHCVVNSVTNNTSLQIKSPVSNTGLLGTGMQISKIDYKYQAFNNVLNSNIVQYYDSNMSETYTYDTFQVKVVMLSNSDVIVPKIDDVRAVGASA